MSRRDNGLTATSYALLTDVETHLVDELLDRLAGAGVAAYSSPTAGHRGPYGETVPPPGPSEQVYVDSAHRDSARTVTDRYLGEVQDDLTWSDLVAGFDTDAGDVVPRWPVSEDVDVRVSEAAKPSTPDVPPAPARSEDHFEPPPPPPLPQIDRISRFAWAGALGGPVFLVLASLLGLTLPGWVGFLALLAFVGGFVTLVARMKDRAPTDSGPDDGAVV